MSNSTRLTRTADVRAIVEPVVSSLGLDLEDIEVQSAGRRRRVCVVVDRDGGIDLDGISETSRAVSDALDAVDAMGEDAYVLEVTSPGVDRPLTLPRHWRRNVGRRVHVHLSDGSVTQGRIRAVDDDHVTCDLDAPSGPEALERRFRWAELGRGEVQVEFRRQQKDQEES